MLFGISLPLSVAFIPLVSRIMRTRSFPQVGAMRTHPTRHSQSFPQVEGVAGRAMRASSVDRPRLL
jgi:hypothetical protein